MNKVTPKQLQHKRNHEDGYEGEGVFGFRPILIDPSSIGADDLTIKNVTVATDKAVLRDYGEEKITITEQSIRNWEVLKTVGIPLTAFHETADRPLGRVTNPVISDGKLKADITFDKRNSLAMEFLLSLKEQELNYDLSITYLINKFTSERLGETLSESRTVTDVTLYDVSLVGLGADDSCGFGRSARNRVSNQQDNNLLLSEMTKESTKVAQEASEKVTQEPIEAGSENTAPATRAAKTSIKAYADLAENYNVSMRSAIDAFEAGQSLSDFKDTIKEAMEKRAANVKSIRFTNSVPQEKPYSDRDADLTLRGAVGAAYKLAAGQNDFDAEEDRALNVSQDLTGSRSGKITVPMGLLVGTRAFQATGSTTGVPTIQTTVYNDRFIDYLYNNTISGQVGVQTEMGLSGNTSTPRLTTIFEAGATAENGKTNSQDVALDMVPMNPHPIVAHTKLSDLAQIQNPGAQSTLSRALMRIMRLKIDSLTFGGGGTNEPSGIGATDGVYRRLTGAANTRRISLRDIRDLIASIENDNVDGEIKIVASPNLVSYLRGFTATNNNNTYVWSENQDMTSYQKSPGFLWGSQVYKSTNIKKFPGNLANGNSDPAGEALIIGDFTKCVQGFWGSEMEMEVTGVEDDRLRRQRTLIVSSYMDVSVTHPEAFRVVANIDTGGAPTGSSIDKKGLLDE